MESNDVSLVLGLLGTSILGIGIGWIAHIVYRRFRLAGTDQCSYCNGHGYFENARARDAVHDATLAESQRFRP